MTGTRLEKVSQEILVIEMNQRKYSKDIDREALVENLDIVEISGIIHTGINH